MKLRSPSRAPARPVCLASAPRDWPGARSARRRWVIGKHTNVEPGTPLGMQQDVGREDTHRASSHRPRGLHLGKPLLVVRCSGQQLCQWLWRCRPETFDAGRLIAQETDLLHERRINALTVSRVDWLNNVVECLPGRKRGAWQEEGNGIHVRERARSSSGGRSNEIHDPRVVQPKSFNSSQTECRVRLGSRQSQMPRPRHSLGTP